MSSLSQPTLHFHSLEFLGFMLLVFLLYFGQGLRWQNYMLLGMSYVFYASFIPIFCLLILGSTTVDFICGAQIDKSEDKKVRKRWLLFSLLFNLGVLGFFKYHNFFADNVEEVFKLVGLRMDWHIRHLILPVGISFYTFQSLSYTIDIYRGQLTPVKSFWDYALFVSFFPQLVAGPIERAKHLLPQLQNERHPTVDGFLSGSWLVFLGIYKKIFVADQIGALVSSTFGTPDSFSLGPFSGIEVLIAACLFSLQVYADFSGYTDVARGVARMLGFDLMQNFRAPYFSRNVQEFWARWHISLSTWIKDYLFFPLALSPKWSRRLGSAGIALVTMTVMGFWHGPSWTYVLWGVYHGLLIALYQRMRPWLFRHTRFEGMVAQRLWILFCIFGIFLLCSFSEIFFRACSVEQSFLMISSLVTNPVLGDAGWQPLLTGLSIYGVMFVLDVIEELTGSHEGLLKLPVVYRRVIQIVILASMLALLVHPELRKHEAFIYFQF